MKHQDPVQISLDEITESYEKGLLDQLRGFGVEGELFETWVPDPDPTNSLLNLAESAITAGSFAQLSVRISKTLMANVSCERLIEGLQGIARVRVHDADDSSIIHLTDFEQLASPSGDSQKIRWDTLRKSAASQMAPNASLVGQGKALAETKQSKKNSLYDLPTGDSFHHEGALQESTRYERITVEEDGCALEVQVDPQSHIVEKAVFRGSWERDVAALLELLCESIESRPVQDMSDHAVGRLEHSVRGSRSRPVPGIVLPSAVDPRFVLIQYFARKILAKYRQSTDFQETENTFDNRVGKSWRLLTDAEKVKRVNQVVQTEAKNLGFDPTQVEVAGLEYDVRLLIRFSGEMASPATDKQPIMMRLEQALIEHLDSRLELFLEPLQDQSTLRRLSGEEE